MKNKRIRNIYNCDLAISNKPNGGIAVGRIIECYLTLNNFFLMKFFYLKIYSI